MCTVSFVPVADEVFILTSNRDENPERAATSLHKLELKDKQLFFPQDSKSKGSWLVFSNTNQFICLLNGAFKPHKPKKSYRLSRGVMACQFFEYKHYLDFLKKFNFQEIEAFTLIVFDRGTLIEVRWDEYKLYTKELSLSEVHLWSSSTLYPQSWQERRYAKLNKEIEEKSIPVDQSAIMKFHRDEFLFERKALTEVYSEDAVPKDVKAETISVSSIKGDKTSFDFKYKRLNDLIQFEKLISFK